MDSESRSVIRVITWGMLASLITIIVCFAILGSLSVAIAIGILSTVIEIPFS